jgi:hypothetical protein
VKYKEIYIFIYITLSQYFTPFFHHNLFLFFHPGSPSPLRHPAGDICTPEVTTPQDRLSGVFIPSGSIPTKIGRKVGHNPTLHP